MIVDLNYLRLPRWCHGRNEKSTWLHAVALSHVSRAWSHVCTRTDIIGPEGPRRETDKGAFMFLMVKLCWVS